MKKIFAAVVLLSLSLPAFPRDAVFSEFSMGMSEAEVTARYPNLRFEKGDAWVSLGNAVLTRCYLDPQEGLYRVESAMREEDWDFIRESGLIPRSSAPAQITQRLRNLVLNPRTRLRGGGYYKFPIERASVPNQAALKIPRSSAPRRLIADEWTHEAARLPGDCGRWTRERAMPLADILRCILWKNGLTATMELRRYFRAAGDREPAVSKQAYLRQR
jgi:hypothetical protein